MKLIRSGNGVETTLVMPSAVDWGAVSGLQVWSLKHTRLRRLDAPGGPDIAWMDAAGVRYATAIMFEDGTWAWTDLTADAEAAITTAHRLAAKHDKPVQRSRRAADELLRARGY